ncbi:ISPsy25, transposase [Pseudomonas ficuserectae]|nr:ISPsy25, transposase [Pseudomonas ficuserectae]
MQSRFTVYLRDGSFSYVRELESSITKFMALRNAQPTRYVWNAKGEEILKKPKEHARSLRRFRKSKLFQKQHTRLLKGNYIHTLLPQQ